MISNLAILATAIGLGGILKTLLDRLLDRRKGRIQEEQTAWDRHDAVRAQLDDERAYRSEYEEALLQTRHCWHIEAGKPYDQMPPRPQRPERK